MEGDLTRETLDRLQKEAEKREQEQRAADKLRPGTDDHRGVKDRKPLESALTPEQRAGMTEFRKSIQERIEGLSKERRDLLKDPSATLELHASRDWCSRPEQVRAVLEQIPEIKARSLAMFSVPDEEIRGRPNSIARLEVLKADEPAGKDRGKAPEGTERLTPEQRAEFRKSIQEGIEGLPKEKRDLLKDPSATIELRVPHGWYVRPDEVDGILREIPGIKARASALEEVTKAEAGGRPNAIVGIDVYTAQTIAEAQRNAPDGAEQQSAAERAERRRVANPDDGIGCPFGGVPERQTILDWAEKRMRPEVRSDLEDPRKTVYVDSYASAPGDKNANKELTDRRGELVRDVLRSLPGVKANIIVRSHGSEEAEGDAGMDDALERVVTVGSTDSSSLGDPAPPRAELPGINEIAEVYKRDYIMDQKSGHRLFARTLADFARGDYRGLLRRDAGADPKEHDADLDRYVREVQRIAGDDPHKALFDVKPWKGFVRDILEDRRMREPIRAVLTTCGFDRKGLETWATHWIRRGAR